MTLVETLESLLNCSTPTNPGNHIWADDIVEMLASIRKSYLQNWMGGNFQDPLPLGLTRVSQLGKPKFVQAARLPHIQEALAEAGLMSHSNTSGEGGWDYTKDAVMQRRFHFGNVIEAQVIVLLRAHGLTITDTQTEVVMSEEHDVLGHTDGVLHHGGKRYVFDVKTMSDYSFTKYTSKKGPHDDNGYITQLACYHHLLGTDGAFLLCYNKNTHKFRVLFLDNDRMGSRWERAKETVELLATVHTLDDLDAIAVPPPVDELYKGKPTGKYVAHPSIKWEPERHLIYRTYTEKKWGKPKEYVLDCYGTIHESGGIHAD